MGSVTGLTALRMLAIEAASVVSGLVNGSGHLILTKHDGTTVDAGNVVGPQGPQGIPGTISSAPAGGSLAGNYPNPTLADGAVSAAAKLADGVVSRVKLASGLAVPAGGGTTQVLKKNSAADGDFSWQDAAPKYTRQTQVISFNASGDGLVTHGLGVTPVAVSAIVASHEGQLNVVSVVTSSIDNDSFTLRLRNAAGVIPSVTRTISWQAFA